MSRQFWSETLAWATASGSPVANTTTETIVFPNVTIPANYMQDGRCLRLRAFGQWSTGNALTPTLAFGVRWGGVGGTVLAKSTAVTTVGTTTAATWELDLMIQTRTNGSAGTLMANGVARLYAGVAATIASNTGDAAVTPMTAGGVTTPATASVDLTADTALAVTATWSSASTANTLTGLNYTIEGIN